MMQQVQPKSAATRADATTVRSSRWPTRMVRTMLSTSLFVWKLDPTDVSRMAGHANYRITLDMDVGSTAGVLDRARQATD
jgi:hypothetical protein